MWGYGLDMWGGGLLMILFWVAVVTLGIFALRTLFGGSQAEQPTPAFHTASEIAKNRYARGEISQEEYFAILETLKEELQ